MKTILIFLLAMMLSCERNHEPFDYVKDGFVEIIEVDGCEYVYIPSGGIAHKGNCKYCIERRTND